MSGIMNRIKDSDKKRLMSVNVNGVDIKFVKSITIEEGKGPIVTVTMTFSAIIVSDEEEEE